MTDQKMRIQNKEPNQLKNRLKLLKNKQRRTNDKGK